MKLRSVREVLPNTRVILKMDTDLPIENQQILDNSRLIKSLPTIKLLLDKGCKILILGFRGRPEGKDSGLTLRPVYVELISLLEERGEMVDSIFIDDVSKTEEIDVALANNNIVFLENVRFWKGEEKNDPDFLNNLTTITQFFVNDAFAVAHRKHKSAMLYKKLPAFYGLSFIEEAEKIRQATENPQKPLVIILGGAKEDKLSYLQELAERADYVLLGGKLPKLAQKYLPTVDPDKVITANLSEDGMDLSEDDIKKFKTIIASARTIIWAGAMGIYEDPNHRSGTEEIAQAVAEAGGYKIIAGGDTTASVKNLGLAEKIDFVCSGGGVMLEYITNGRLAAIGE